MTDVDVQLPQQRDAECPDAEFPDDGFGALGLGGALALTGVLAAVKLAETATSVVLSATGVFNPGEPPANPGGE